MTDQPFPFVGAGEAGYFEWAEVHVRFIRAPKPAERTKIAAKVPIPLRDSIDWTHAHLAVASSQGVGRLIEAAYAKPPKAPKKLTTAGKFTIARSGKYARFNADIEAWLRAAHAIVPILVAYRCQDWEAGGTKLSPWHHASLVHGRALMKQLAKSEPEKWMRDGIAAECEREAAATTGPTAAERADELSRAFVNIKNLKGSLACAKLRLAELTSDEAYWLAADQLADDGVVCNRDNRLLAHSGARAIVLEVMRKALLGKTPADHVKASQTWFVKGTQKWRLPRILAVAVEAALRAGDAKALAQFKRGLDLTRADQRSELESSATELDEEGLEALAKKVRAIAHR